MRRRWPNSCRLAGRGTMAALEPQAMGWRVPHGGSISSFALGRRDDGLLGVVGMDDANGRADLYPRGPVGFIDGRNAPVFLPGACTRQATAEALSRALS